LRRKAIFLAERKERKEGTRGELLRVGIGFFFEFDPVVKELPKRLFNFFQSYIELGDKL
jgi:hypothetical protein